MRLPGGCSGHMAAGRRGDKSSWGSDYDLGRAATVGQPPPATGSYSPRRGVQGCVRTARPARLPLTLAKQRDENVVAGWTCRQHSLLHSHGRRPDWGRPRRRRGGARGFRPRLDRAGRWSLHAVYERSVGRAATPRPRAVTCRPAEDRSLRSMYIAAPVIWSRRRSTSPRSSRRNRARSPAGGPRRCAYTLRGWSWRARGHRSLYAGRRRHRAHDEVDRMHPGTGGHRPHQLHYGAAGRLSWRDELRQRRWGALGLASHDGLGRSAR